VGCFLAAACGAVVASLLFGAEMGSNQPLERSAQRLSPYQHIQMMEEAHDLAAA